MSFFSKIVNQAKKVVKRTLPAVGAIAPFIPGAQGFSAANILGGAIMGRIPGPLQSFAGPLVKSATENLFSSQMPASSLVQQPIAQPGGAMLVSGRNKAAAVKRERRFQTTLGRQTSTLQDFVRTQGSLATGSARASLAPVSRESLGFPTRDIVVQPGGGSRLPPGVRGVKAMSTLPTLARAIPGIVRTATGKISRIVTPEGRSFSRKQVVSFAKRFGPEAAAAALGVTVADVLSGILDDSTTRRRRRGITPRDLQTTRRTICKVKNMHKMISGTPVRRRTCK